MKRKYSRKKLRQISHFKVIKNAPVALLIFGIVIFQILWFISLSEISITYDFSNYTEENINVDSFDTFMEDVFTYIKENQINFTEAVNEVLQNETLMSEINSHLNYTITTVEQIIEAVRNETLAEIYLNQFIRQLWLNSIPYFISEGYFQSAYINFTNKGWATIQNIDVYLDLFFRNQTYRLLKPLKGMESLSSGQPLILNFSIASFLTNLIMLSFDTLVEITIRLVLETGDFIENILIYFNELFDETNISAKIHFSGTFGFIPLSIDLIIELKTIIQDIIGGL